MVSMNEMDTSIMQLSTISNAWEMLFKLLRRELSFRYA